MLLGIFKYTNLSSIPPKYTAYLVFLPLASLYLARAEVTRPLLVVYSLISTFAPSLNSCLSISLALQSAPLSCFLQFLQAPLK
jgi:hypothetical protein